MTASQLAKEMKARKVASGWEARCPAHDDQNASLSISEGSDGRVLLHCHAGCSFGDVATALQIPPAELFPPKENGHHTAPVTPTPKSSSNPPKVYKTISDAIRDLERKHGTETGRWDYLDASGDLVGIVLRFDPPAGKTIRPLRISDDGNGWVLSGMPEPRPLYHLPDIIENPDATVYVCEGEKAAEAGTKVGLLTTTSPHGANSANKADWSALAGRDVVILPDNDDPGRKYAASVRDLLAGIAASVRIVELPGLPPGGDLVEWVGAGKGKVEIDALIPAEEAASKKALLVASGGWKDQLNWVYRNDTRKPKADAYNLALILANEAGSAIAWDEFVSDVVCIAAPPWHTDEYAHMGRTTLGKPWVDADYTRLRLWLQREWRLNFSKPDVYDVVPMVAQKNRYHPVAQYLRSMRWDGVPRVGGWLTTYLGAEESDYTRFVAPKWLIAAVARVLQPGCKADNVLVLEGQQGTGKSTALNVLAGSWFSDSPLHITTRDAFLNLRGSWIIELAELDSLMRVEDSAAKSFFTSATDKYRPPYARASYEYPRQCVFAGSVNHTDYLRDPTGARRYWPVASQYIDIAALRRDRDQLWAETLVRHERGEQWHLRENEQAAAREEQAKRTMNDPWEEPIIDWLRDPMGGLGEPYVTITQILRNAISMDTEKMNRSHETRVGGIMRQLGWLRKRERVNGEQKTVYYRRPDG